MAVVTLLLVRYNGGFFEVEDAAAVAAWGRKEGFVQFGSVSDHDEAQRVAEAILGFQNAPRVATTLGIEPTGAGDDPYADYAVGDTIHAPDVGGDTDQRVMSLTVSEDQNGDVSFANELKATFLVQEEAFDRQLKKLLNGSMRGQTLSANPLPTGSVTRADVGDSLSALRAYTNAQLLTRLERSPLSNVTGPGGGTFDPDTDQAMQFDGTFTVQSVAGYATLPFPTDTFPAGLLTIVSVQVGELLAGTPYLAIPVNSSSDRTQVVALVVDVSGAPYPDATDLILNLTAIGW